MSHYFEKYESFLKNEPDIVHCFNNILQSMLDEEKVDINFLEYILISSDLNAERQIYRTEAIQYGRLSFEEMVLNFASEKNCVEAIKLILTHPEVDRKYIDRTLDYSLYLASSKGALECVEYLSTCPDLEKLANVNQIRSPLIAACENGHLNIVKFLLESPKLKVRASLTEIEDYYVFSHLCKVFESTHVSTFKSTLFESEEEQKDLVDRRLAVMKYLILENNLNKNDAIEKYINKSENQTIKLIFDVQELNSELNAASSNGTVKRKPKL